MPTQLSRRALNRATLARQWLLARVERTAAETVEHLVGLQAQAPFPPYYGLWSRIAGFDPAELADALVDRRLVRIVLMRGTVHLVTAADAAFLRPLVQVIMDRDLRTNTAHRSALDGLDLPAVAAAATAALADEALPGRRLGEVLARRWPDRSPAALAHAARGLLALVQVPPRAVWGHSGQTTYRTLADWTGTEPDPAPDPARLVRRYLAAFGPATVADLQTWSGLTRLREIVEPLRPGMRTFTDEAGRELFDLPDAPRPDPDTPAPVRFVAEFDNLLLSHADRTRVMPEEHRRRLFLVKNGVFPGTILVDGFLRGEWRITKDRTGATLTVTPYASLSTKDTAALEREGARLLAFAHPAVGSRDVTFAPL